MGKGKKPFYDTFIKEGPFEDVNLQKDTLLIRIQKSMKRSWEVSIKICV